MKFAKFLRASFFYRASAVAASSYDIYFNNPCRPKILQQVLVFKGSSNDGRFPHDIAKFDFLGLIVREV